MTSSEAAAWVQALGGIAAVLAAFSVSAKQFSDATQLQREAISAEHTRRYRALSGLIAAAIESFDEAHSALKAPNFVQLFDETSHIELMDEYVQALRQISVLEMPSEWTVRSLIKFRDLLGTATWNAKSALSHGVAEPTKFQSCVEAMEDNLVAVKAEYQLLARELAAK